MIIPQKEKNELGKKLRAKRKRLHLSQMQLSEILGITQANISAYENGKQSPKKKTLEILNNFILNYWHILNNLLIYI